MNSYDLWKTNPLHKICVKVTDGSHYSPKEKPSTAYKIATVKDFSEYGLNFNSCKTISKEDYEKLIASDCKPNINDVLISKDGTMGIVFVVKEKIEIVILSSIAIIRPNTNEIDPHYLGYFLKWRKTQNYLSTGFSSGTALPRIVLKDLKLLPITYPPLPEQRAIGAILGSLDDKIGLNYRMNHTLEKMAQTLFKSWFVDFEPFRDQGMEDSTMGPIPRGWRVGKIDDLAILGRRSIIPCNFPDELFDHYSIPSFDEYNIPKAEKGEQIKSNKYEVPKNAVLISKLNPRFPRVWFPLIDNTRRAISSTEFLVTITKKNITSELVYSLFKSASFFEKFSALVTGTSSSHQRVRPDDLLRIDIVIPSTQAINDFTDLTAPIYELVQNNLLESATLASTRDTLLPKLLSGEIRVKDAEKFVEEKI